MTVRCAGPDPTDPFAVHGGDLDEHKQAALLIIEFRVGIVHPLVSELLGRRAEDAQRHLQDLR